MSQISCSATFCKPSSFESTHTHTRARGRAVYWRLTVGILQNETNQGLVFCSIKPWHRQSDGAIEPYKYTIFPLFSPLALFCFNRELSSFYLPFKSRIVIILPHVRLYARICRRKWDVDTYPFCRELSRHCWSPILINMHREEIHFSLFSSFKKLKKYIALYLRMQSKYLLLYIPEAT